MQHMQCGVCYGAVSVCMSVTDTLSVLYKTVEHIITLECRTTA